MSNERPEVSERGEAVLSIFRRGAEFTKELLDENKRLREDLSALQDRQNHAAQSPEEWEKLRVELSQRIAQLETTNRDILDQLREIESENHEFASRYLEIEEENNNLANLYVAGYQLHSTLDPTEVVKAIIEIVINLVGAEVFCVYAADEQGDSLYAIAAEGRSPSEFEAVSAETGFIGESLRRAQVAIREAGEAGPDEPVVCIPLRVQGTAVGAIAIYRLLQQKEGFSELDRELFTMLAGHAATALFGSRLYSQSERKLSTIKGFIELLSQ